MNEIELPKITKMDGITMVPLPRGLFEMNLNPAVAMPNCCELEVIGGTRADNSWIAPAGDEVVVRVIARDKYKNDTHWEEGQNITVEALGPEFLSFAAHGTTSLQNEFVAKMTRAGTFELRVLCDALPVCWRAMQIIAGFTFPRSILSMDGLKDVKTGDIVRLTLRTVDKYANLRLSGGDTVQVVLQGPNGALARQVSVTDHQDGRRCWEFQVTAAGRGFSTRESTASFTRMAAYLSSSRLVRSPRKKPCSSLILRCLPTPRWSADKRAIYECTDWAGRRTTAS